MGLYFLSPEAVQDLQEINDYLFSGNPDSADSFLNIISEKFEQLVKFPRMGRERNELAPKLRSFPFQVYLIFYRIIGEDVEIVRVLSGYRGLEALFNP